MCTTTQDMFKDWDKKNTGKKKKKLKSEWIK